MSSLLLHNATLVDGTGSTPVPSAAVLIDDGKIAWAGAESDLPTSPSGERPTPVDLAGNTICPGFFDCHVHLGLPGAGGLPLDRVLHPLSYHYFQLVERLRVTLHNGVTTARTSWASTPGCARPWPTDWWRALGSSSRST